ncbi:RES family NAD+ phosphorylase [Saccharopolyspora erythraea]|uniref:RES family NAD+ phosphorylase n=1 Tax=Saccharopolyspora erythraea TaxID=1836 RepID=UPI001BA4BC04|nr:RES family NAD+ phosphorylase [Saccharopolyspora erythraea]QUH03381.1 RES family NAD+ phosphorylase [Saccharopolyspora erythraea]
MADLAPPPKYAGTPVRHELPADAELWRVHSDEFDATSFRPGPSDDHFGGGRFDGTERDPYPGYYAALGAPTALMEFLARDLRVRDDGTRRVLRRKVAGRRISGVRTTRPLDLVSLLSGPHLAAVAQDEWLVQSEEYGKTRRWASWIRQQAPWADGLIWLSKRDPEGRAVVLFGDRCGPDALEPATSVELGTLEGAHYLNDVLDPYRVTVSLPPSAKAQG